MKIQNKFAFGLFGFVAMVPVAPHANAFPLFLKASEAPALVGRARKNVVAFSSPDGGKNWERIPVQVDEIEDDAFLILRTPDIIFPIRDKVNHPPARDPFEGNVSRFHRLALDENKFEKCNDTCAGMAALGVKKICDNRGSAGPIYKVTASYTGKSAFLASCENTPLSGPRAIINFDEKSKVVRTKFYSAQLSPESPFLLDWLKLENQTKPAIQLSELRAKLKTRMLMSFNIDKTDLGGTLASVNNLPLSTSLEIATTEKVMGIKLVEQVCCDISFFEDAFYFPVLINIPSAIGKLKTGSEVSFGLQSTNPAENSLISSNPPASLFLQNDRFVAVAFRPSGKKRNVQASLLNANETKDRGFKEQNIAMAVSLGDAEGEQRFEAWFYMGNNAALLKEYASHGVKHSVQALSSKLP